MKLLLDLVPLVLRGWEGNCFSVLLYWEGEMENATL